MWTKHNPPRKSKYSNYSPHIKIKSKGANTVLARARSEIPGDTGSTVLYRDHVKGAVHYDKRLQRSVDVALPPALYKTLEYYTLLPEEKVPPLIAVELRRRRELSTADWKRQVQTRRYCFIVLPGRTHRIYCMLQGQIAYFIEEDLVRMRIRRSKDFQSHYARQLAESERRLLALKWIDSVEIPTQAVSDPI